MNRTGLDEPQSGIAKGTARRILEAGEEILAERGYESLSMRAIAARVGISQAAIYRHYADKDALVGAIVAKGYSRIIAALESVDATAGAEPEMLAAAIRKYINLSLENPALFKAVLLRPIGPAQAGTNVLAKGLSSSGRRSMAILVGLLERGMAKGAFAPADPELTAQALWAATFGLIARVVLEGLPEGEHRRALIERQIDIVLHGLGAKSARA